MYVDKYVMMYRPLSCYETSLAHTSVLESCGSCGELKLGFASEALCGPVHGLALSEQERGLENHRAGGQ